VIPHRKVVRQRKSIELSSHTKTESSNENGPISFKEERKVMENPFLRGP
jgi:hypothetical protein